MKFFEDGLRKRFDGASAKEGVDADALWEAIEGNLPEEGDAVAKPVSWWRWPVVGLLLIGIATAWYFMATAEDQVSEKSKLQATIIKEEMADLDKERVQLTVPQVKQTLVQDDPQVLEAKEKQRTLLPTLQVLTSEESSRKRAISNQKDARQHQLVVQSAPGSESELSLESTPGRERVVGGLDEIDKGDHNALLHKEKTTREDARKALGGDVVKKMEGARSILGIQKLSLAAIPLLTVPKRQFERSVVMRNGPRSLAFGNKDPRFSLGVYAGANLLLRTYESSSTDDLGAALNRSAGSALGQAGSVELRYRLTERLSLISGFAVDRHHSTFSFVSERDTLLPREGFPGQTINGIATRTVDHNNFETTISAPLLLEYFRPFGDFELGFAGGVAWNKVIRQSGKLLNNDNRIVSYGEGAEVALPTSATYLSYQLRPSLSYALSDKLFLQLRTELRYQNYGVSPLFGAKHQALRVGASLGVRIGL